MEGLYQLAQIPLLLLVQFEAGAELVRTRNGNTPQNCCRPALTHSCKQAANFQMAKWLRQINRLRCAVKRLDQFSGAADRRLRGWKGPQAMLDSIFTTGFLQ